LSILSAERHPRENRDSETSLNLGKLPTILRGVREDQIKSGMLTFLDFSHRFDCIPRCCRRHLVVHSITSSASTFAGAVTTLQELLPLCRYIPERTPSFLDCI